MPPQTLNWADAALELALSSKHPVVVFTRIVPIRAVVSGLVLLRAGVEIQNVCNGDLDDEGFTRLTMWLARMSKANLAFVEDLPGTPETVVKEVANYKFVFRC